MSKGNCPWNNAKFKSELINMHGDTCCNCGSTESIEWHHVVPRALGGTNNPRNIIPLCWKCHKTIHRGITIDDLKDGKPNYGGRKRKNVELANTVFEHYINGEIGNRKCKELIGYSQRTQIIDRAQFKDFLKERGIKSVRNNIDIVGSNSPDKLLGGAPVGMIKYEDGRSEYMLYNDTGLNDIDYVLRGAACES